MSQQRNGRPLSPVQISLHEVVPNDQERAIYKEVMIDGRLARDVAVQRHLSEARVNSAVYRVRRWLAQLRVSVDLRALLALHVQRLEHQWHEAMTAWYRSGGKDETIKVSFEGQSAKKATASASKASASSASTCKAAGANGAVAKRGVVEDADAKPAAEVGKRKIERTTREVGGDVRYLEQARKIMAEIRALSTETLTALAKEQRDDATLTPTERNQEAARHVVEIRERERKREAAD